jgi:acetyl esterase/lipase
MRLLATLTLAAVLSFFTVARPGAAAQAPPGRTLTNVTYCTAGGVALLMDLYLPQTQGGRAAPAAIYVHGGRWIRGDKTEGGGSGGIPDLVRRGFVVAAINYRLGARGRFPAQIQDVKCAVRHLRALAGAYRLDPRRIGIWGSSAGAHLAALAGVTDARAGFEGTGGYPRESSRVAAVVDLYGPADLSAPDFYARERRVLNRVFGASAATDPALARASPVTYVSADDPPFLIMHGELDVAVPVSQSRALYRRLRGVGVPAQLIIVRNAGHGFSAQGGSTQPSGAERSRIFMEFMERYVGQAGNR